MTEQKAPQEKEIWAYGHKAVYIRTITEDKDGRWDNESLSLKDGYVVVHKGVNHYVYRIDDEDSYENRTDGYYNDDGFGFVPQDAMERSGV